MHSNDAEFLIPADDPDAIRRGRIWLAWSATALSAFVIVTTLIGLGITERRERSVYKASAAEAYMAGVMADLTRGLPGY